MSETGTFSIKIESTGDVFDVPEDKSILHVLVSNGYRIESSCTSGLCGMCRVRYSEGEIDHRDLVLDDDEKSEYLTTCVSRAKSSQIVLDLPAPGDMEPVPDQPIAVVDQDICVACLTCVRACTYGAAKIDSDLVGVGGIMGAAIVDDDVCTGCGLCAAACPTGAISMTRFADLDVNSQVSDLFQPGVLKGAIGAMADRPAEEPQVIAFACPHCAPSATAFNQYQDPENRIGLQVVELPCTGRVDNLHLMKTFDAGADGVIVAGCEPGMCYHSTGNLNAAKRVERARAWLDDVGLGGERVRMVNLPRDGAESFAAETKGLADDIRECGASPLRKTGDGNTGEDPGQIANWTRVCDVADVPPGKMRKYDVKGIAVMVANLGDILRVFPPSCPHMAEPLEESGTLEDEVLTCTKHIWQWNLRTMELCGMAERPVETYPSKVENGEVLASIDMEIIYEFDEEEELDDDDFFSA